MKTARRWWCSFHQIISRIFQNFPEFSFRQKGTEMHEFRYFFLTNNSIQTSSDLSIKWIYLYYTYCILFKLILLYYTFSLWIIPLEDPLIFWSNKRWSHDLFILYFSPMNNSRILSESRKLFRNNSFWKMYNFKNLQEFNQFIHILSRNFDFIRIEIEYSNIQKYPREI